MKKAICIILFVVISLFSYMSVAEGLLPSLSETVGIAMPSLGEALKCYPDSETENDDGSVTEIYTNVSETDFSTFSVYLESQGAELADYHVEGNVLTAEIRAKDASFSLSYDTKSGEAKVTYPAGTFSEWMKNAKAHFDVGQKLLEEGKADEAYAEFLVIPQYSKYVPVVDLLQNDDNFAAAVAYDARYDSYRTPGNIVVFGQYEQDNNVANGSEDIEWIVLDYDEKEHKALLLSRYGLDVKPYNEKKENTTWEKCSLRRWLNGFFLRSAFSKEQQTKILMIVVDNSALQRYNNWDGDGGNDTQDQIFLLSYAEANHYLGVAYVSHDDNIKARVAPTEYAIANGAYISDSNQTADGDAAGWWWLRSPGDFQNHAADVDTPGSLGMYPVRNGGGVIRPAFWLDLESDYFK